MSQLPPPLPITRRLGSPPTTAGLEAAIRAGRRKILRETSWAAGSAMLALVVLAMNVMTAGPDGSRDPSIVQQTNPPRPVTSPRSATPTAHRTAVGSPPGQPGSPGPVVPEPTAVPQPEPSHEPSSVRRSFQERPQQSGGSHYCDAADVVRGTPPGTQLCATSSSQPLVESGQSMTITLELCNSLVSASDATLAYRTGREHDVAVLDETGRARWTWSHAYAFPQGAHTRVLVRGYCLRWQTVWDTADDAGNLLPPGKYTVESSLELDGQTRRFTADLEIQPPATPQAPPTPPVPGG